MQRNNRNRNRDVRGSGQCTSGRDCHTRDCTWIHPNMWCKFEEDCNDYDCDRRHPWERNRICLSGEQCYNIECTFIHPRRRRRAICKKGEDCNIFDCSRIHPPNRTKPCRFSGDCFNYNCSFLHPLMRSLCHESCRLSNCQALHPTERQGKDCIHGIKCMNYDCDFLHPSERKNKCLKGAECQEKNCSLLHPMGELFKKLTMPTKSSDHLIHQVDKKLKILIRSVLTRHKERICLKWSQIVATKNKAVHDLTLTLEKLNWILEEKRAHDAELVELQAQLTQFEEKVGNLLSNSKLNNRTIFREIFHLSPFQINKDGKRILTKPLPALAMRGHFEELILKHPVVVVQGETGSGKSTQLPQYLADFLGGQIICTQPRKIAAISLAERVSYEWSGGCLHHIVGRDVGYRVGGRSKVLKNTRIIYMTEEVLVNILLDKPMTLSRYSAIVIDEAHERNVSTDLLLGLMKQEIKNNPNLRVVVTSATLDVDKFRAYFTTSSEVPALKIPGRLFPVEVHHTRVPESKDIVDAAVELASVLHRTTDVKSGDILVFLTGQDETEIAKKKLERVLAQDKPATVLTLYGQMLADTQQEVLAPALPGRRKIVFSTNVAETSVTIDGVRYVIDSGLTKISVYDDQRNMTVLQVAAISQSSAIQRSGRAGRTSPGVCYRLYSQDEFEAMHTGQIPELLRTPLGLTVLNLTKRGIDPLTFDFIDCPDLQKVTMSIKELTILGAVKQKEEKLKLTKFGHFVVSLQIDPKIAKIAYYGLCKGYSNDAVTLAALMTISSNIWWRGGDTSKKNVADTIKEQIVTKEGWYKFGDLVALFYLFKKWETVSDWWNEQEEVNQEVDNEQEEVNQEVDNEQEDNQASVTNTTIEFEVPSQLILEDTGEGTITVEQIDSQDLEELSDLVNSLDTDSPDPVQVEEAFKKNLKKSTNKINHHRLQELRKKFCLAYSVNHKSLTMAYKTRNEMLHIMKKLPYWKEQTNPSDKEQLQKIIFSGLFCNLAIRTSKIYYSLQYGQVGYIHPGSVLQLQDISNNPGFIVYQQMMMTSKSFFMQVTPIPTIDWLDDVAPLYANSIREKLSVALVPQTVGPLCYSTIRAVFGKRMSKLAEIEKEIGAILEVNPPNVTIWAEKSLKAKDILETKIKEHIEILLNETQEEVIVGNTRAVFGTGCQVQQILLKDEFVRVNLRGIPTTWTPNKIRELLTPFGVITSFGCEQIKDVSEGNSLWAWATFTSSQAAEKAMSSLDHKILEYGKVLSCKRGGVHTISQTSAGDVTFKISWSTGVSEGKAKLGFVGAYDANELITHFAVLKTSFGNLFKVKIDQKCPLPKTDDKIALYHLLPVKKKLQKEALFQVMCYNIPLHFDEQDIITVLQKHGFTSPTQVYLFRKEESVETITEENILMLRSVVKSGPPEQILWESEIPSGKNRAGLFFRLNSVGVALERVSQVNDLQIRVLNQPVRAEVVAQHTFMCHKRLYTQLKEKFHQILEYSKQSGIQTVEQKNSTHIKILLKMTVYSTADGIKVFPVFSEVLRQLNTLLKCKVFDHKLANLLLSVEGRKLMENLKDGYVHWDNNTRMIRLYGTRIQIQQVEQTLIDFINKADCLPAHEMNFSRSCARKVFKNQRVLREFTGVSLLKVHKTTLYVRCTIDGLFNIKKWFEKNGISESSSVDNGELTENECPLCLGPIDKPFVLQACGHSFCESCIEHKLSIVEMPIPVLCDFPNCNKAFVWKDILLGSMSSNVLNPLMRESFRRYLLQNNERYKACPGIDCDQIRRVSSEGRFTCDVCVESYCTKCSETLETIVLYHEGKSCQEFVAEKKADKTGVLHMGVADIHPCPSCRIPVTKGKGCFHITCTCEAHFCWGCLELKSDKPEACTCKSSSSWKKKCQYVYHHMDKCDRPVNK